MANPFAVQPVNILQALMMGTEGYDRGQKAMQQSALNEAGQLYAAGDLKGAQAAAARGGSLQALMGFANLNNNDRDFAFRQTEAQRAQGNTEVSQKLQERQLAQSAAQHAAQLGISRSQLGLQERQLQAQLDGSKIPAGFERTPDGALRPIPGGPTDPAYLNASRKPPELSAGDKKAIYSAEDDNLALDATIAAVKRAKELNPNIFTGRAANVKAAIGTSGFPGAGYIADPKTAALTSEWDQIMGGEAIKNMSATLKGASTDFEMNKFIGLMADTTKPPEVRQAAMDRILQLAERKRQINEIRMQQLRGGGYFKPGGGADGALPTPRPAPAGGVELPPLPEGFGIIK